MGTDFEVRNVSVAATSQLEQLCRIHTCATGSSPSTPPRLAGELIDVDIRDCTPTTLLGRVHTKEQVSGGLLPVLA